MLRFFYLLDKFICIKYDVLLKVYEFILVDEKKDDCMLYLLIF